MAGFGATGRSIDLEQAVSTVRGPLPSDENSILALARSGDEEAVRCLVARHNQLLFRVARGYVSDDAEAEDVVQETYARAFTRLDTFRGGSAFSTWLTRIAINEALQRIRKRRPTTGLDNIVEAAPHAHGGNVVMFPIVPTAPDPEEETGRERIRITLEKAVDELPEPFRAVFILRDVQGLSTARTASCLSIEAGTVKTRLHRARRLMRESIARELSPRFRDLFPFDGERCANMADRVIDRLEKPR